MLVVSPLVLRADGGIAQKDIERAEAEIKKNNELLQSNKSRQKTASNLSPVDGKHQNRKVS